MAITDHLTGLHNRTPWSAESRSTGRDTGRAVGIIFADLDGFKRVNDEHGHAAGDDVLAEVAKRMKRGVPPPNSVFRVGGDEFVVLVPAVDQTSVVAGLAERICTLLSGRYTVGALDVWLSASVGWTWGPTDDLEDLIRRADADMYRHKARSRGLAQP